MLNCHNEDVMVLECPRKPVIIAHVANGDVLLLPAPPGTARPDERRELAADLLALDRT